MADENGSAVTNSGATGNPETANAGTTAAATVNPMVIPDAFKGEKSLASFKSHDDFVKSHLELSKKLGDAVWLPKEKDDAVSKSDKMNRIYKALGRPDAFDGYDAASLKDSTMSEVQVNELRNWAHSNNMSQSQFNSAADYLKNAHAHAQEAIRTQTKADEDSMRAEWGDALFKQRANLAAAAIKKLGGEDLAKTFAERGLGSNKKLVEIFSKIGSDLLEGSAFDAGEAPGALSKADAQAKINEVNANPNDLYHRKHAGKAGHKERVEEMRQWFQIVHS